MINRDDNIQRMLEKLDQLIVLYKLANKDVIRHAWDEINKEVVGRTLMELVDGSFDSSELQKRVASTTGKNERTVRTRLGDLVRLGALRPIRKGNKIFYESTGVFD